MDKAKKEKLAGIIIIACAAIVIFWEAAGLIARQPGDDFTLTPADFENFELTIPGWKTERMPVDSNFLEVNLLKLRLRKQPGQLSVISYQLSGGGKNPVATRNGAIQATPSNQYPITNNTTAPILVRLVHGYNMVDCMKIKEYTVEEIEPVAKLLSSQVVKSGENDSPATGNRQPATNLRYAQLWRLTSKAGDTSLWMSGMIRAGKFAEMDLSTTDMAFPKIGMPDDPRWVPRGLTLKSLRHPVRNLKWFFRAKWNNSRCDLLTFLGLRRPAWASDEALTLLVISEQEGTEELMAEVYREVLAQLREWKRSGERWTVSSRRWTVGGER